jgi:F0F1-type ATP synthase assembly protein I
MIRAARYTGAGLEFAASVALLAWLGSIADARWATTPWLTVVGAFLGIAGGTWLLVRPFLGPPREEGDGER